MRTKRILEDEFRESTYVASNPYGNAGSRRKLEEYIIESVISNVDKADCLDWIEDLQKQYGVREEDIASTKSLAEIQYTVLYRYVKSKETNKN